MAGRGCLPTFRCAPQAVCPEAPPPGEKSSPYFYFQVIHPEALAGTFSCGRTQEENVAAVAADMLGHGNDGARFPGSAFEAAAQRSIEAGGLLFSAVEIDELRKNATDCGVVLPPSFEVYSG